MDEDADDGTLFTAFQPQAFLEILHSITSLNLAMEPSPDNDQIEIRKLQKLADILNIYQEQAYLLDPYLENLVVPVAEALRNHAKVFVNSPRATYSSARVNRLALLMYYYVKFRGYKSIVRYFPHEVSDLSIALDYILSPEGPVQEVSQWPLRYAVLLWLSLICMLPFDLAQFDENTIPGSTATKLEYAARLRLDKSGLERDGAALMLSRLYMRKDTHVRLPDFLDWSNESIQASSDILTCMGVLQVIAEVTKSGPMELFEPHIARMRWIASSTTDNAKLSKNSIIRKLRIKIISRIASRVLPVRQMRIMRKGQLLSSGNQNTRLEDPDTNDHDFQVPESVEVIVEDLFGSVQDTDTIVRWSSAKGLARISERLPSDYVDQVLDTVMGLFAIHAIYDGDRLELPSIAESTWHGASLACAELARRGLVNDSRLPELVKWMSIALFFDVRKGAHSVGSSVRDAAAYVLWSLARTQSIQDLKPYANQLAQTLVTVALYDREIHIRRAASAAFQENVGRTDLFPHGIDVLGKCDFYAVSNRLNAFLIAAPQVAHHEDYRPSLIEHLLTVTLRHWDPVMRQLGAQSLRKICEQKLSMISPSTISRVADLLKSVDTADIQGGLLALTELARAANESECKDDLSVLCRTIFKYLAVIPTSTILSPRNTLIAEAACYLIASSISAAEIELQSESSVPHWRTIVEECLKHRSTPVQEAATAAMTSVSKLVDCSFRTASASMQQSLARLLGMLDYSAFPHGIDAAIRCLLEGVERSSPNAFSDIEARRNAFLAMSQIVNTVSVKLTERLSPATVQAIFVALEDGLEDYTVNERGDVGSWIRIVCIQGLCSISRLLLSTATANPEFPEYLPAERYQSAVGGILKQGVERLDKVRQQAGEHFLHLMNHPLPKVANNARWKLCGKSSLEKLFTSDEALGWHDGNWLFPRAVRILDVVEYRQPVLKGLVLSVGSKTGSTQRPVSVSLTQYAMSLDVENPQSAYDLQRLIDDLNLLGTENMSVNNIMIPVLQAYNILLEADIIGRLGTHPKGLEAIRSLFRLATRNVDRLKNMHRIIESMKIVVNLIAIPEMHDQSIPMLDCFLQHKFPKVRADTAEFMYLIFQTKDLGIDTEEAEEILLGTEWTSLDAFALVEPAEKILALIKS